ncbi:acyl-CoA dehydrogenase C-terminal domain-containing protein [Stappia stellulata]|uniref:acyl-CoA dehydrogenase family protein n=1 Tax=Stappia stellulata TaxID=71235 RepID=UPI001CD55D2C|nr:acyl-CoA dehydrogenase family protein [Stappia stellulata]MCA1244369.1 acyl-CoA dehydrogenase C-terminal domain-containing protein [Stappia stellulata]
MFRPPVSEIAFTLKEVAGLADVVAQEGAGDLSGDLVDAILEEAGRFAAEEIVPLNAVGDRVGARLADGVVTMPPGWKEAYRAWSEGGWNALTGAPEYGGQGLPMMLHAAALEMWNFGSMAFAIGPTLTMGAVEALEKHATAELRETYLPKLISGEWMGTMNLTEPQAGSDLNALRARAERADDGTYRIFGQKIYITYGEHDFTDNIVHLVLARLPDAPAGTRGLSLFLVPKFFVEDDGSLGARNDVRCAGMEHKLGIHASPTCTMVYGDEGGAVGWLIGEENRGLACMFTMMNNARLSVGIQGLGVAERATQQALAYALERRQGRAPGETGKGMSPIANHPDIQRSLLDMQSWTQVARATCFCTAHALDMARLDGDAAVRGRWSDRAALLTPIAKALSTDIGVEVASIGVQIHGGMGYVEETGAAQHLRDARIAPIYEGTNGIQAIDLVARKLPLSGGEAIRGLMAELDAIAVSARAAEAGLSGTGRQLETAIAHLRETVDWLLDALGQGRQQEALAGATPFLRLLGTVFGGAMLAKGALASLGDNTPAGARRVHLARYFAAAHLGEAASLKAQVLQASAAVLAYDPAA